jgi:DNA-binding NtrC family response regulator
MPANLIAPATLRVLVVEDERRLRQLLLEEIPEMGFSAAGVASAEEARRLLSSASATSDQACDIVLLDLQLPGMGGMEFFQQVRQNSPQLEVIILSGFGDLDAARQAIHLNVVDFLTKPCRLNELESALDRACRRIRQRGPTARSANQEQPVQSPVTPPLPPLSPDANPATTPAGAAAATAAVTLAQHERQLIIEALARHGGNRSAAAAELGISRRKLHYRLAEYRTTDNDE